jgi:hypothetical protein
MMHTVCVFNAYGHQKKRHPFQRVSSCMILIHYAILLLVKLTAESTQAVLKQN